MKQLPKATKNAKASGAFQSWWLKLGRKKGLPSPEEIFIAGYEAATKKLSQPAAGDPGRIAIPADFTIIR